MDAKSKKEFIQRVFSYMDDFEKAYLWNIYQDAIGGTIYIDELTDDFIFQVNFAVIEQHKQLIRCHTL